jgi:hypothetical protein
VDGSRERKSWDGGRGAEGLYKNAQRVTLDGGADSQITPSLSPAANQRPDHPA